MKDLNYYKNNAEENYITTPISVLRYITELEKENSKKQLTIYSVVVSFFKRLKSKYTMTYNRSLFVDTVNGKMVNEYKDCYQNIFMAQSKLGYRTRKN